MIGMSFVAFLTLLVIAVVVAAVFHFVLRYRFLEGLDAFLAKVAVGWLGGWLAPPVLGHWLFNFQGVYIIPAAVGAVTAVFLNVLYWKAWAKACRGGSGA